MREAAGFRYWPTGFVRNGRVAEDRELREIEARQEARSGLRPRSSARRGSGRCRPARSSRFVRAGAPTPARSRCPSSMAMMAAISVSWKVTMKPGEQFAAARAASSRRTCRDRPSAPGRARRDIAPGAGGRGRGRAGWRRAPPARRICEPAAATAKSPGSARISMKAMNDTPSRIASVQARRMSDHAHHHAGSCRRAPAHAPTSSARSCGHRSGCWRPAAHSP